MNIETSSEQGSQSATADNIRELYQMILNSWNERNAQAMASFFVEAGNIVGFDGSAINGRAEIETHLSQIFRDHPTAAYVGKVREVRFLTLDVALLRAVVGMVPPGQSDISPNVNAIQTLVVSSQAGQWRVEIFQSTPAAFHGRPELSQALTDELRQLL